jgi:molybdenum cofactor guanylyltransferase
VVPSEHGMDRPARSAAAIMAGGKATRMGGRPKSFLVVEGRRIVDRQLELLRPRHDEIFLVANDVARYAPLGLPVHPDVVEGAGPLAGILAAVLAARAERVIVLACDMPFVTAEALDLLEEGDEDVVVPVVGGRPEPLLARYSRACAAPIRARLEAGERKVTSFFADVTVRELPEAQLRALDPTLRFLSNCNAPEDLL